MPRQRKETAEVFNLTLAVAFTVQDIADLINDVTLSLRHAAHALKPAGHAYKLATLKALYNVNPTAFNAGLLEARHVWSDVAIGHLLNTLQGAAESHDDPQDANTFYALKAIREMAQVMPPNTKLSWSIADYDQVQLFAFAQEIERQGYATFISGGRLTIQSPKASGEPA